MMLETRFGRKKLQGRTLEELGSRHKRTDGKLLRGYDPASKLLCHLSGGSALLEELGHLLPLQTA
jgi:hypothetical protein